MDRNRFQRRPFVGRAVDAVQQLLERIGRGDRRRARQQRHCAGFAHETGEILVNEPERGAQLHLPQRRQPRGRALQPAAPGGGRTAVHVGHRAGASCARPKDEHRQPRPARVRQRRARQLVARLDVAALLMHRPHREAGLCRDASVGETVGRGEDSGGATLGRDEVPHRAAASQREDVGLHDPGRRLDPIAPGVQPLDRFVAPAQPEERFRKPQDGGSGPRRQCPAGACGPKRSFRVAESGAIERRAPRADERPRHHRLVFRPLPRVAKRVRRPVDSTGFEARLAEDTGRPRRELAHAPGREGCRTARQHALRGTAAVQRREPFASRQRAFEPCRSDEMCAT